ncbi:MAG: hypothetical protein Q9177_003936 [Variospora cf. flavescens]
MPAHSTKKFSWKPFTLRWPILIIIAAGTLAVIVVLEILSQQSRITGAVAFTGSQSSSAISFAYLYLPTVVALLYSILWSWIDLDTKRLEPWFQLSNPGGAKAEDSLLLHYPYDFLAFAPVNALRRSSIFARSIVTVDVLSSFKTNAELMQLGNQSSSLNTNFLMNAYGISWLGQEMPGFVTRQGTLEPFEVNGAPATDMVNRTWTARTRLYGTSINCEEAEITEHANGYSYSNRKGCTTFPGHVNVNPEWGFRGLYIGYYTDQHSDYSLEGLGCASSVNSHLFLGLWGKSSKVHDHQPTAFFCEPNYWIQNVNATVTVPTMSVSSMAPLGPQVPLPDSKFNSSAFEYIIGTGAQLVSQRADISATTSVIDQTAGLAGLGYNDTVTNVLGFALGLSRLPLAQYAEHHNLVSSLETAHKLLHALAIKDLLTKNISDQYERQGRISGRTHAIKVVRPLAVTVELLLGSVVILTLALLFHASRRKSQLCADPDSLRDIVAMMPRDHNSLNISAGQTQRSAKPQNGLIQGKLSLVRSHTSFQHRPKSDKIIANSSTTLSAVQEDNSQQRHPSPYRTLPFEMSSTVGILFLVFLGAALSVVVALKLIFENGNGLPLPSKRTVVNQLVLNYVPIVFATILEPFWLLLNRILCLLQPYKELSEGHAAASQSLDLKYASLPPQLTVWRALRAGHYLLSSVCAIGLSANLLAVSLNGLMDTDFVSIEQIMPFALEFQSVFRHSPQPRDQLQTAASTYQYVANANITYGVILPPWTTPATYFVPFALTTRSRSGIVEAYKAATRGFGIEPNCQPSTLNHTAFVTGQQEFWYSRERTLAGRSVTCGAFTVSYGGQNNSNAALEVFHQLNPLNSLSTDNGSGSHAGANIASNATNDEFLACNGVLIAGFLRGNLSMSFDNIKTQNSLTSKHPGILKVNELSSTWLACRPKFVTGLYDVTVDPDGHVESYTAIAQSDESTGSFFVNGTSPALLVSAATSILTHGSNTAPYWHNDTFVDTWFAHFVKHLSNSTDLVDPAARVPQFESVRPYVEDIYARLFAIVLSLNRDWLSPADMGSTLPGKMIVSTERVFMSNTMFIITITLLALNIVVATTYWAKRPRKMLPKKPYTIAKIMEMFEGSHLVTDVEDAERWQSEWKFGYGRFVGTDGKLHVGIDRQPFIKPFAS